MPRKNPFAVKKTINQGGTGKKTTQLAGSAMRVNGRILSPKERRKRIKRIQRELRQKPRNFSRDLLKIMEEAKNRIPDSPALFVKKDGMLFLSKARVDKLKNGYARSLFVPIKKLLNSVPEREGPRLLHTAIDILGKRALEMKKRVVFNQKGDSMQLSLEASKELDRAFGQELH